MPSTFTHSLVGYALAKCFFGPKSTKAIVVSSIIAANLADIDVIGYHLGFDDNSALGHRGITHSIFFVAAIVPLMAAFISRTFGFKKVALSKLNLLFFLVFLSHPLMDAFSDGQFGVAFFAPFDNTRILFGSGVIVDVPMWDEFFQSQTVAAIKSEMFAIWLPIFIIWFFWRYVNYCVSVLARYAESVRQFILVQFE